MNNITTQRIRALSKEQGRTLRYLCDKIGVKSGTYFQDIEKQDRSIPMDKLEIIAQALDTSTDYLLGKTDSPLASPTAKPSPFLATPENEKESRLLLAYRSQPEMQPAVDRILGITDDGNITLYTAAKSSDNIAPQTIEISQKRWEEFMNTPKTDSTEPN